MKLILLIVIVVCLLVLGLCFWAARFFVAVALQKNNKWYATQGHKMLNPSVYEQPDPPISATEREQLALGNAFYEQPVGQDIFIQSRDKLRLKARELKLYPAGHHWLIAVHGYRSTGKRDMGYPSRQFSAMGYNILIPDLRAHGASEGEIIGMGWLDRLDLQDWINYIVKQDPAADILLYGGSMGAATVMMTSGEVLPKNVVGLIADSGYTSVDDEFRAMLKAAFRLPAFPIIPMTDFWSRRLAHYSLAEASAVNQLSKNTLPLLLIHGTGDKFVPHRMSYENMEAAMGPKELLLVEKAPHLSSLIYEPDTYMETVRAFISANVKASPMAGSTDASLVKGS